MWCHPRAHEIRARAAPVLRACARAARTARERLATRWNESCRRPTQALDASREPLDIGTRKERPGKPRTTTGEHQARMTSRSNPHRVLRDPDRRPHAETVQRRRTRPNAPAAGLERHTSGTSPMIERFPRAAERVRLRRDPRARPRSARRDGLSRARSLRLRSFVFSIALGVDGTAGLFGSRLRF
jgi:hypothetical protein